MSPYQLTIREARARLDSKELSAVELTQSVLDRIDVVDSKVRAFLSMDRDDAIRQAEGADAAIADGNTAPLLGIPIAIKDVLAVKGQPLGCASKMLEGFISPYDATSIGKLKAAGAVVFGRVNMDEFAMGSSTENSGYMPSNNPWDLDRTPGGSSGGSAAAVAADECLASIGSDTGGSIRQPASFCGCVGLKPSYGRISRYGLVAFASSLDQIGPITKTVDDAATLFQTMQGADPMDATSAQVAPFEWNAPETPDLSGVRVGVPAEYFSEGLDPEVKTLTEAAIQQLVDLGAEIRDIHLPHTDYAVATYYIIATAEASANLARFDGVRYGARVEGEDLFEMHSKTRGQGFGPEVKRRILLGTYVLSSGYYDAYYTRALKTRTLIKRDFENAFNEVDVIAGPACPTPAFRKGEQVSDPLKMYLNDIFTLSCNLAGICGVSVPCGFTESGLPVGLQLQGKAFDEASILRVASAYETTHSFRERRPTL